MKKKRNTILLNPEKESVVTMKLIVLIYRKKINRVHTVWKKRLNTERIHVANVYIRKGVQTEHGKEGKKIMSGRREDNVSRKEIELYKISEDLEELKQNDLFAEDGGSGGSSRNRQR